MADPYQALGTAVIVPTGGLTLAWTAVITDGSTTATLNTSDSADPILTAGTYSPEGFMQHAANKIRASLYARLVADAWVTTKPAAATDLTVQIGMPATITAGVGTVPLSITVNMNNVPKRAGVSVTFSSFTLTNTSNNWCYLGLANPGESRALTITAGVVSAVAGRFQPRWLFFFRSTFRDSGDLVRYYGHKTELLDNGKVRSYDLGRGPQWERDLVLVDLPQHIVGPPWVVGRFSAFGATRELLTIESAYSQLLNISSNNKITTNLVSPAYLYAGQWWARYNTETPTDTFKCFDVWPSTRTPTAGEPVQVISEAEALEKEARRVGLLFRYDPDDSTGTTNWLPKAYALRSDAQPRPIRRASGNLFYSIEYPLILVPNPALATP